MPLLDPLQNKPVLNRDRESLVVEELRQQVQVCLLMGALSV
jgi:hypothetical protein